ncbi:protein FAM133-like [Haliotis cracherodii]|uniref:protein FAM133-like n=1 Tax=Haliotis cracherodii TaxID=6455 RepID=UPI0039E8993A
MDKDSFFKDRVLHRLYGDKDTDLVKHQNDKSSHETTRTSPSHQVATKRKVYTVSPAPCDWGDNSVNNNVKTSAELPPVSSESASSETNESDDGAQTPYKRRKRRGKRFKIDPNKADVLRSESGPLDVKSESSKQTNNFDSNSGDQTKLTKNQKRKLKKKKRKEKVKESLPSDLNTEFVYGATCDH